MNKQYTYQDLLQAHINVGRYPYLRDYYAGLASALERLFQVQVMNVAPSAVPERFQWPLYKLLHDTVLALQRHGLLSGWLEGGPASALMQMNNTQPQATHTYDLLREVLTQERTLNQHYRRLAYDLFALLFGKIDLTFTSEDLRRMGFDDSNEPEFDEFSD